jgi:hypothetical protein
VSDLASVSDDELLASLPRGVRTNNPLNLKGSDGQFRTFNNMDEGMAAADANLAAYGTKHGINTLAGAISRWAPPSENDTGAYVAHVSKATGIAPNAPINLGDPNTRRALLTAMAAHENGAPVVRNDLSGVSDAELMASLGPTARPAAVKPAPCLPSARSTVAPLRNEPARLRRLAW